MGLAETLGNLINQFGATKQTNIQQDLQAHKLDVSNFWKQAEMSNDINKFVINTGIKFDQMEKADQKNMANQYDTRMDNIRGLLNDDKSAWAATTDKNVKKFLMSRISKHEKTIANLDGAMEKLYPIEKQIFDAGQQGYDVDEMGRQGDQLYGRDLDATEEKEGRRADGSTMAQVKRDAPTVRITQEPGQPARRETIDGDISSNVSNANVVPSSSVSGYTGDTSSTGRQMLPRRDDNEIEILQNQVRDLIGKVQDKIERGRDGDAQSLNIPGRQDVQIQPQARDIQPQDIQPQESTQYQDPRFAAQTPAQIEADRYIGEQIGKEEQESYDRAINQLTAKYKYLDTKGISVEDEKINVENNIIEKQKLVDWIEHMASAGRTRAKSPSDFVLTGLQQLAGAVSPGIKKLYKRPKYVQGAWWGRHSTDTTKLVNEIERDKIKLQELGELSSYYTPGGSIPSARETEIETGMTEEQQAKASKRQSLYGGYR
jgi:hypothetical protein